jgi:REP-associated tyrosine transposase
LVFHDDRLSRSLLDLLQTESARLSFRTDAYCFLPDHVHFLSEGVQATSDLIHFVNCRKLKSSRFYARKFGRPLWQKGYYEHILRGHDRLKCVGWYIGMNPGRRGIAQHPGEYAYSGSFSGCTMSGAWRTLEWWPPWKRTLATVLTEV